MSLRKQTKLTLFTLAILFSWSSSLLYTSLSAQASSYYSCNKETSAFNKSACHYTHLSNTNWWAWLKGESHSAHFHFLDLVELLHKSGLKK